MNFEMYIARRYFGSGRFFVSVATWISIVGVTLGVAVLCIVMSAHNGFEAEIRERLLGTTSHISLFSLNGEFISDYEDVIGKVMAVDDVLAASPFIYYKAAISSAAAGDGIIIRGIDLESERRTAKIEESITAGVYSFAPIVSGEDTIPGILLGRSLAERLGVYLGESVVLYSLRGEDLHSRARPRVAKFYVSGLFETGMFEFDDQMAYISLASAQKLFRTGNAVTTIHLKLTDIYLAEKIAPIIDETLDYRFDVVPWHVMHRNLFSWIKLEKLFLSLGFVLVVLVAAFSIISTLVMLTMEKRAEIGILKTIGTTPGSVGAVFVYKGMMIGAIGVIAGWLIALVVAYVQNTYRVISLPPDIYFISYLPIDMQLPDFILTGAVTLAICFAASLYPARQAAGASVIDVLRQ